MQMVDFINNASKPSTLDALKRALAEKKACAWRLRKAKLEFAVADAFDPIFTLAATRGRDATATIYSNVALDKAGFDAQGIALHLKTIMGGRYALDLRVAAAPADGAADVAQISLLDTRLRSALETRFGLPAAVNPVVNLRVEEPTERTPEGTKQYGDSSDPRRLEPVLGSYFGPTGSGTRTIPRLYMSAVYVVLGNHSKIAIDAKKVDREGVVAIVADRRGNVVSWALKNQNVDCWHGETMSVIRLGGTLPAGGVVFSSLKPCHMCSGVLRHAGGTDVKVYWGMDDVNVEGATVLESERLGGTLGANKATDDVFHAKALLLEGHKPGTDLAGKLMGDFAKLGGKGLGGSAINFSAAPGGDAETSFKKVQGNLAAKTQQYAEKAKSGQAYNTNVAAVLGYLNGFLKTQVKVV